MACLGYFFKNSRELKMRRTMGLRDDLGVRWSGRVTRGEASVEHALRTEDQQVRLRPQHLEHARTLGGKVDVDPVLQAHTSTK